MWFEIKQCDLLPHSFENSRVLAASSSWRVNADTFLLSPSLVVLGRRLGWSGELDFPVGLGRPHVPSFKMKGAPDCFWTTCLPVVHHKAVDLSWRVQIQSNRLGINKVEHRGAFSEWALKIGWQ